VRLSWSEPETGRDNRQSLSPVSSLMASVWVQVYNMSSKSTETEESESRTQSVELGCAVEDSGR
jgi:hypothetical protein